MNITYTPLLQIQRRLQGIPRGPERFQEYLRTILNDDRDDVQLAPLVLMNPMGKDHVTALLDAYLELNADVIAAEAIAAAGASYRDRTGDFRASLVVVDDLMGGWTNRYAYELDLRRPDVTQRRYWITGILWSSEPASLLAVRMALMTAVHRTAYIQQNGPPATLRQLLAQEGAVMKLAGCTGPTLDDDELAFTRHILDQHLDAADPRTMIECLFGDTAGATLGFSRRGLSPGAGLALALHDALVGARVRS